MSLDEMRWVRAANPVCEGNGCQFATGIEAMRVAEEAMKVMDEDVALWCGVGGHAFSGRDPGRQKVTVQQWDDDSQAMKPVSVAACGDHARPVRIATRPGKVITNGAPADGQPGKVLVDREEHARYLAWLEQQAQADV